MPASAVDEFEPPTELEVQVLGHLLGNLSSAALLLLGWLTFQLWRDYISTILAAFIVSQAMRRMRERMVSDVRSLRAPSEAPLLRRVGGASLRHAWACPPLLLLAVVVPLLLLADYTSWGWVGTACASAVAVVVVPVWLLDRRLLSYTALLSDESLVTLALVGLVSLVACVSLVLLLHSLVDLALLLGHSSEWTRARVASDDDVAAAVEQVLSSGRSVVYSGIATLSEADPRWSGASRVLQLLESGRNTTEVLGAVSAVMRDFFPHSPVLREGDALDRLLLLLAGGLSSGHSDRAARLGGRQLAPTWRGVVHAFGELRQELPSLLGYLSPDGLWAAWQRTGEHGSAAALLLVSLLLRLLYAVYFILSLGLSTLVCLTMTFYMLAAEQDAVSRIFATVAPRVSERRVEEIRGTIEAVLLVPIDSAARNACATLLLFRVMRVPYAHLAAMLSVVFTLFPLTYSFLACVPWVGGLVASGRHAEGLLLLLSMALFFTISDLYAERRLQQQAGVSQYVNGFSLVLGVYMFGLQGLLFGPLLVCGAKRMYEYTGHIIQQAELGEASRPAGGSDSDSDDDAECAAAAAASAVPVRARFSGSQGGSPRIERRGSGAQSPVPTRAPTRTAAAKDAADAAAAAAAAAAARQASQVCAEAAVRQSEPPGLESRGSIEVLSREALKTMRRFSFFSPPSRLGGARRAPGAAPRPDVADAGAASARLFDVCVRCDGSHGQCIRLSVCPETEWDDLLSCVTDRLRRLGFTAPAQAAVALRAAGGLLVASASDLRPNEVLDAEIRDGATPRRASLDFRLAADSSNGSAAEAMAAAVASAPVTASPSGRGTPDTPSASPAFGTRPTQLTL